MQKEQKAGIHEIEPCADMERTADTGISRQIEKTGGSLNGEIDADS